MHGRHANDEREQIVDERVEGTIDQRAPRQMSDGLALVASQLQVRKYSKDKRVLCDLLDEELRRHGDETKRVNETSGGGHDPRVPALVCLVHDGVNGVPEQQGIECPGQVLHRVNVVLFGRGGIWVLVRQLDVRQAFPFMDWHVDCTRHFPAFNQQTHADTAEHEPTGLVVEEVQEDDHIAHKIDVQRAHWEAFHRLFLAPELNVCHAD